MTVAYGWCDAGSKPEEEPLIAVMSVVSYLQAQVHLHQLAC